jgi:Carboxypeptidase regulatory-like domain
MHHFQSTISQRISRGVSSCIHLSALFLLTVLLLTPAAFAQRATGTISGTVEDKSQAVIPNATITLENTATHDKRAITSNGTGFFNFAAVPPGTYTLTITAHGFNTLTATQVVIHAGEDHGIPNLELGVAGEQQQVEVTASEAAVIPTDSGTSSTTINQDLVENMSIQGRDAAELVKFMPGMGMNNGLSQNEFNSQTTATNSGPIGQFSASGTQPYGGMQMTLDGAGLVDVGNMGTQIANVNQDTTAEFTYLNAAFGADTPRGPTIIAITSKAGSAKYHGDVYTYARNWQANANDAYYKSANPGASRPMDHQLYPGGTIGGPIPFVGSRLKDKLFFFGGFEKMLQNPFPTIHYLVTPTQDMLNGDFSTATLPGAQTGNSSWWPSAQVPCANAPNWTSYCGSGTSQSGFADWNNGVLTNKSIIDPDGLALMTYLMKIHPANVDPKTHNGYNYQYLDNPPVNRWEARGRVDFNPTDRDKFAVVYTQQNEGDVNNFGIWWDPGFASPMPSSISATTLAKLYTANYTRILSPTSTNELSYSYSYFTFPPTYKDPAAMTAATAGFVNHNPFGQPAANAFDQLPNIISWGAGTGNSSGSFSGIYGPPAIKKFGNGYGNKKMITSFQDNFTKVIGRHSLKAGFFWDDNHQIQTTGYGNWSQGAIEFDTWSSYTTNNPYADMLIGHTDGESQVADAPVHDMAYHEWAIYAQDSWHVSNKLTLNYGVRFDHDGQWYPLSGPGVAVWDAAAYKTDSNDNSGAPINDFPGMRWHQNDKSIPISGFKSQLLVPDPRVGAAYDVYGNGKTVLRGGFGIYRWQFSEGDIDPALNPSYDVQSITTASTQSFAALAGFAPNKSTWCAMPQGASASAPNSAWGGGSCPTGVDGIMKGEDKTPYTTNWDAMIDQELPGHTVFELQYIGNATRNALLSGNGSGESFYSNINKIPQGAMWGTYHLAGSPNDGQSLWQMACATGHCATSGNPYLPGYRPYKDYGVLNVVQHGSYSNYNGMVVALQKQAGRASFLVNYTWSKVMGIRDGQSDNGNGDGATVNPFNLRANYGPLSYDHTHIFNAAYVVHLPGVPVQNMLVKQATSGWDLSGDTQVQSGAPIQPNTQGTLNVQWTGSAGQNYYLGTNAEVLMPYLTCDPSATKGGARFNVSCFQTPTTLGKNGPTVWPDITGPKFINSDLALAKTFQIREAQNIQFRASAFNFINHALPQFGLGSDINLQMNCDSTNQGSTTPTCNAGGLNHNAQTTGKPYYETGRRVVEVALKYNF